MGAFVLRDKDIMKPWIRPLGFISVGDFLLDLILPQIRA